MNVKVPAWISAPPPVVKDGGADRGPAPARVPDSGPEGGAAGPEGNTRLTAADGSPRVERLVRRVLIADDPRHGSTEAPNLRFFARAAHRNSVVGA